MMFRCYLLKISLVSQFSFSGFRLLFCSCYLFRFSLGSRKVSYWRVSIRNLYFEMSRKNSRAPEMMNFSNGFHRAVFFQFSVSNFIKAWILPPPGNFSLPGYILHNLSPCLVWHGMRWLLGEVVEKKDLKVCLATQLEPQPGSAS